MKFNHRPYIRKMPVVLASALLVAASAKLFAFDSAELSAGGKNAIEGYRKQLRPELSEAYAGIIISHTDSRASESGLVHRGGRTYR
jgi:outer membrane protein OmpA-like peptidoglycan-associated protein